MNFADFFIGWHPQTLHLVDFSVLTDLPKAQQAFDAHRQKALCIWQVLDDLDFLPVDGEPAVKLIKLRDVEQQDGSF